MKRIEIVLLTLIAAFIISSGPQGLLHPYRVQSYLQQLATSEPDDLVRVIVQTNGRNQDQLQQEIAALGGTVVRKLAMLNAFVVDVRAAAIPKLAEIQSVQWLSLDAPVTTSQLSVAAAPVASDEFSRQDYANSDGNLRWSKPWQEVGESDGAANGDVAITTFYGGALQGLRLQGAAHGVVRALNLAGAKSASVVMAYRRKDFAAQDTVSIDVSFDGGATWQTHHHLGAPASNTVTDPDIQYTQVSMAGDFSSNTLIRLLTSADFSPNARFYLDRIDVLASGDPVAERALTRQVYLPLVANTTDSANQMLEMVNGACSTCTSTIQPVVSLSGSIYVQAIKANPLWNQSPSLQGQNVTVAVVDSGIADPLDLRDSLGQSRVLTHVNFTSASGLIDDFYGHGTHVAGIIGGNGSQSDGMYVGVAPNVNLVDVKVTDDYGMGSTSQVVAGLEWVLLNKDLYNIKVVNLSLNSTVAESYHTSALNAALEILWFNKIAVFVSAGNSGSQTLYPPANDPFLVAVGAVDDRNTADITDDTLASFSAYKTTPEGYIKPDLVAPGANIIAPLASDDSNLALRFPENLIFSSTGSPYIKMSGTSMASAVAAGAAALLAQDEPTLTPDQIKYRLMVTAQPLPSMNPCAVGAGYLDIQAAVNATSTANANLGVQASQMLWSGIDPLTWGSVNWNSVNWNSVNWNSVNWNSVNWNLVNGNSADTGNTLITSTVTKECVRYVRLVADSEVNGNAFASAAEINLLDKYGAPINRSGWKITADSEQNSSTGSNPASNAIDGNTNTIWHSASDNTTISFPHELVIDMGTGYTLGGLRYLPRQESISDGTIAGYKVYVSSNGINWGPLISQGTFANNQNEKTVWFNTVN